jgi:L-lactate dehydrogenase complex protein LldF
VKIDIPRMLIGLREMQHHEPRMKSRWEKLAYRLSCAVLRRPWLYRLAVKAARLGMGLMARGGWVRALPGPGAGWTSVRDFPAPARRSFREMWPRI